MPIPLWTPWILDGNHYHVETHRTRKVSDRLSRSQRMVDEWCLRFEQRCRERGLRVTPQRLTVYRALATDPSHPTADALHARIRPGMPSLSLATVYRILEALEENGLVRRVSAVDGIARFDANLAQHQHLVCRMCGTIVDIEEETLSAMSLPPIEIPGFVPDALDIRILGTCSSCREDPSSVRRSRVPKRSK